VQDHVALLTAHEAYHLARSQPDPDPVTEEHHISYQAILLVQSLGFHVTAVLPEDAVPCPQRTTGHGRGHWRPAGTTRAMERYAAVVARRRR
jgi:hypothetical protein